METATDLWTSVDTYITEQLAPHDASLDAALAAGADNGLPSIDVTAPQGKLLALFAQMVGARTILELGTLAGYSTIWMARALAADGSVVSLEIDPDYARVARGNLERAGVGDRVQVIEGAALDTLPALVDDPRAPFDLVFVDADKQNMPAYVEWALKLTHAGSIIVCDNVVRDGLLVDADSDDPMVQGARAVHDLVAREPRLDATTIQTVGAKGHDGFLIARVVGQDGTAGTEA